MDDQSLDDLGADHGHDGHCGRGDFEVHVAQCLVQQRRSLEYFGRRLVAFRVQHVQVSVVEFFVDEALEYVVDGPLDWCVQLDSCDHYVHYDCDCGYDYDYYRVVCFVHVLQVLVLQF